MTTCSGKSCKFGFTVSEYVTFVHEYQFVGVLLNPLVLRMVCGI